MVRVRLRFSKVGPVRYTSHLDTARMFRRCFNACGLPLYYSKGYHPHPRISFGPSLRTGWEGLNEYMDIFLERSVEGFDGACNRFLPEGLRITGSALIDKRAPSLAEDISAAAFEVCFDRYCQCPPDEQATPTGAALDAKFGTDCNPQQRWSRPPVSGTESAEQGHAEGNLDVSILARPLEAFLPPASCTGKNDEKDKGIFLPEVLHMSINVKNDLVLVEYLSTMKSGKSCNPEKLAAAIFKFPVACKKPPRVIRKELFVRRRGELISPIKG